MSEKWLDGNHSDVENFLSFNGGLVQGAYFFILLSQHVIRLLSSARGS
jgi:hypothetical protein